MSMHVTESELQELESVRLAKRQSEGEAAIAILTAATMQAALTVTHMAKHGDDERMRFQAAKYILDKTLSLSPGAVDDELTKFVKAISLEHPHPEEKTQQEAAQEDDDDLEDAPTHVEGE